MKKTVLKLLALASTSVWAYGHGTGNGGDSDVYEFLAYAKIWSTEISAAGKSAALSSEQQTQLLRSFSSARVVVKDEALLLRGVEVDAINYPDANLIHFNRSRWRANDSVQKRAGLVLHEYLGLSRITDHDYKVSTKLVGFFPNLYNFAALKWQAERNLRVLKNIRDAQNKKPTSAAYLCLTLGRAQIRHNDLYASLRINQTSLESRASCAYLKQGETLSHFIAQYFKMIQGQCIERKTDAESERSFGEDIGKVIEESAKLQRCLN